MSKFRTYETSRLILRPSNLDDAAFMLELMNSPKWLENIGDRNIKNLSDAEHYITERIQPQFKRLGFGNYTLIRKLDNVKIGTGGLYDRDGLEGIDIGFALLPQYEKMGYAFESTLKVKSLAFNDFKLSKINAITLPSNKASQNLLIKLGFNFDKLIHILNDPEELMLFVVEAS